VTKKVVGVFVRFRAPLQHRLLTNFKMKKILIIHLQAETIVLLYGNGVAVAVLNCCISK
jgi:hypothetical protein